MLKVDSIIHMGAVCVIRIHEFYFTQRNLPADVELITIYQLCSDL